MKYMFLVLSLLFVISCGISEDSRPKDPQAEYTVETPGEWAGMESKHTPKFEIESIVPGKKMLIIRTEDLKYFDENHYIQRVGVYNKDKNDLVSLSLDRPMKGKFQSVNVKLDLSFPLEVKQRQMVYVRCNLHDTWVAPLLPQN
ncbi:hypothetical protein ACQV5M_00960 [Leptospira sp. SA-E8]|uniref:hypothetical protein n=1 Tax=Leptospira sp. SA-E8 TaxID=3422259 RepID=UPI003EBDE7CF